MRRRNVPAELHDDIRHSDVKLSYVGIEKKEEKKQHGSRLVLKIRPQPERQTLTGVQSCKKWSASYKTKPEKKKKRVALCFFFLLSFSSLVCV